MSNLKDALRKSLGYSGSPTDHARGIVTTLGITREMVEDFHFALCGFDCSKEPYRCYVCGIADALTALLDVAEEQSEVSDEHG
jgi:hypothetical protein